MDCIHGGADKDTLTRLLAENVVLHGPLGEQVSGREAAVETIRTVNSLAVDDSCSSTWKLTTFAVTCNMAVWP
ncbi:MAG: hypothetical protein M3Y83_16695 [Actinomycetota bacterium]|nr:hypothetical protein [Actinomycetota bacterium]